MPRNLLTSLAAALTLTACASGPQPDPKQPAWRVSGASTVTPGPRPADSLLRHAHDREPASAPGRLRFISTSYRSAAPSLRAGYGGGLPAAPTLAMILASRANDAEFLKADSMLTSLAAQNRAADTMQAEKQAAETHEISQRPQKQRPPGFDFKPTNIRRTDTVFVDTLGVRLAVWLGPQGVQMKVADGVLVKTREGTTLNVSVQPGFDWHPYKGGLLVLGSAAALAIMVGLGVSLFRPAA